MSSATAQRAGRAPKDKNKPQPSHSTTKTPSETSKAAETIVSKIQPTAEQLRIAQIINDANNYPDLKDKVERIIEVTGKTTDAALVALHDCDNDSNRATIMLLEGNQDEGKWETSYKKKKNRQAQQKALEVNGHDPAPIEKDEKEPVETTNKRREPKQREGGYRYRGPPRMNRGNQGGRNWRNKENEKNERNLQDGPSRRDRNMEGRSRGPRKNFSSGRGRGRGGRSRTFQNRGLQNNDGFPESIDTWQNSTAEKVNMTNTADATMTVGNWSDVAVTEEWSEEDWTENLTETKVFTPSAGTQQSSAVAGLDIPPTNALGQNIDLTSFLQKPSTNSENTSNSLSSNNVTQQGQTPMMSQQIPQMQQNVAPQSQSNFDFSQYAKQAADQIKAAVGVVTQPTSSASSVNANSFQSNNASYQSSYNINSNTSNQHHVQIPHELQQVIVSQSNYTSGSQSSMHMSRELHSPVVSQQSSSAPSAKTTSTSQHQTALPQRVKPPKARLPPPSKIPESAVVMPDDAVTSLDVQFGALQFGTDSSPFDFTAGGETNNSYQELGQNSNGTSHVNNQTLPSSITSQSYSNPLPSPVTMNKDTTYNIGTHNSPSQNSISSDLNQSQKVASQDNMLMSQNEHKTVENVSSYINHRANQSSNLDGSMMSSKADQSALNSYSTSSHDSASAYSYGNQKSVLNSSNLVPSTVSYTHTSASLNSGSADLSSNQASQPKYQAQVANQNQNASSYVSSASSYGLQSSAYSGSVSTSGSTYPSQTGYSSHASASYGSSNSGYSNQQGVYSGSITTSAQSGTMISTSVSSSKLTNSLSHGVKESSLLESQHSSSQHTYEVASTTSSSSVLSATSLAPTSSVNHSVQNSSNMNSVLGLVSTSSSTTTTSVLKNSLSATGKAVQNIPQNVPAMLGHQYIMSQASLPFYGLQQPVYSYEDVQMLQSKMSAMGIQSPVYSYEDVQMLQSKLSTLGYYDMQFQAPTSMTGRDPGMGSVAYTTDGKYSRSETDASTVATTLSQGQANTQAHGQAFLNPALPPGYGYYFAGGMMTGGIHHYAAPPIFPVPPATNTHGATTNTQFQKASAYGSHSYNSGYDSLTQTQDYTKGTYGAASQNQVKGVSGSGAVPDLSGSVYSKSHAQLAKYNDKPGFHTGTPPPFNLAGSQAAGPLGASSGPYAAQFIPVLAHGQHHSTALLHHHMQQDTSQTGGTPTAGQRVPQGLGQPKNSSKQNYAYWTSN
ncbi:protein lingerer [Trichonephila inaurata madagascariensis]|uniref:Protein lingerer n=1 Tax=Trichonephila inaurata madagascariensis TaxID=2747483 RepID=A0A8X6YAI3_9ARAC|nr:protein lingerer [Trichonephila inaurata madagascariensis]